MEENFMNLYLPLKEYMDEKDIEEIHKAFLFSSKAHESQIRKSGEPYIIHPIGVSIILASQKLPKEVIIAGLLHDVVEDTDFDLDDVKENFNEDIAYIVDGVTKLTHIEDYTHDQLQAENHRKILVSAAKDIRVLLVKLADRLHNMRTLKYMNKEKQKLIANETLEVYAPIAHRLGMYEVKWELEDLSFKTLNPEKYREIANMIDLKRSEREDIINYLFNNVSNMLSDRGIEAKVKGRSKHIYSIYKKINQGKHFEDIMDLFAFRIIVKTIPECYISLGVIHENFKPIPLKFKDYIPTPKHNMYQSIHTTVITKEGIPVEFQIRTEQMDKEAETGIASHWMYKEGKSNEDLQKEINKKLTWLRRLVEDGELEQDSRRFMNKAKGDFLSKTLFVFTPNGDIIELPQGTTTLDFAFYIHSDIGLEALSAKVNDKVVSLFYKLQMGDVVKIITSKHAYPSINWLSKVKTTRAKETLRKYFKDEENKKIADEGKSLFLTLKERLSQEEMIDFRDEKKLIEIANEFGISELDKFYLSIGLGEISIEDIDYVLKRKEKSEENKIIKIDGARDNFKYKICKFCSPLPGDKLKANKLDIKNLEQYYIHREECYRLTDYIDVDLFENPIESYVCRIEIAIIDTPNALYDVINIFNKQNIKNITSIYGRASLEGQGKIKVSFLIKSLSDYLELKVKLEELEVVDSVERIIGLKETI